MRLAAGLAAALAAGTAQAADVARGQALAERWCVECHVTGAGAAGGDAGPPLATLTGPVATDDAALTVWLSDPHDPMPDLGLAPPEIADLVAYIRSLAP